MRILNEMPAHSEGKVEHKFNYADAEADAIFLIFNNTREEKFSLN